jgi:predicted transposase YdaD
MVLTTLEEEQAPEEARALLVRAQQEIPEPEASRAIIEIIATIMVYMFTNLSRQEVDAMLGLQFSDTRVYREAKEEGRQEEAASLVLRLLTRRFGEVPQNLAQQIRELPINEIETLGEAFLDFQSLSDVVNWLGQ